MASGVVRAEGTLVATGVRVGAVTSAPPVRADEAAGDGSAVGCVGGLRTGSTVAGTDADARALTVGVAEGWAVGLVEVAGLAHAAAMNTIAKSSAGLRARRLARFNIFPLNRDELWEKSPVELDAISRYNG